MERPDDIDTDDDQINDGDEINIYETNPLSIDTDGETLRMAGNPINGTDH